MLSVGRYFRLSWQLLLIIAAALAIGAGVVRPLVAAPFFLFAFAYLSPLNNWLSEQRRYSAMAAVAGLMALSVHEILRAERFDQLVEILMEIICATLPLLMRSLERTRSYWLSLLNVTILAISSITLKANVPVYLGFVAFIAVLLFNLNAATLYHAALAQRATIVNLPTGYFRQFAYVFPGGILSAALIFFAFPRVQTFGLSLGNMMAKSHTGYVGMISLSGQGEMLSSHELALLIESEDKAWLRQVAPSLLLRGDALDTFDGKRWSNTVFNFKSRERAQDVRVLNKHELKTHNLTIHREPTVNNAVFYPGVLLHVAGQSRNNEFLFNVNGSVIRTQFGFERATYSAKIAMALPMSAVPSAALATIKSQVSLRPALDAFPYEMPESDLASYLAIPPVVAQAQWFKDWLLEVGIDAQSEGIAGFDRKVRAEFSEKFKATLKNTFSDQNTFAAFIKTDRQGHCEYFATATALMLRAMGVPSRVVVGYRGGHYNDLIDALEVSEDSAHAWVEAYIPDYGWQALDPTPDSAGGVEAAAPWRRYVTALSFWFRQYVVDYDHATQQSLLKDIKDFGGKQSGQGWDLRSILTRAYRPIALVLVAVMGLAMLVWMIRRRQAAPKMPGYYRKFISKVAAKGLRRQSGETLRAFHQRCLAAGVDAQLIAEVDAAIEADFYQT